MSVPKNLIRIGFATLGLGYALDLFRKDESSDIDDVTPSGRVKGMGALGRGRSVPTGQVKPLVVKDGIRTIKFYPAGGIDNRVKFIVQQIRKDAKDPKTITEARAIVSGKCQADKGGSLDWCIQPKDWKGELRALFAAVTNPNSKIAMRYTRDPWGYDAFGSSDSHRRLPSGDCDDFTIRLGALCYAIGYPVRARVVAPSGAPNQWAHIYLMVGDVPGEAPERWLPLDPTEPQHPPFWEVPKHLISSVKDFDV